MRVLLLAEQCNPDQSSVPLEGYNYCTSIARNVEEVVVATAIRNSDAINLQCNSKVDWRFVDNNNISKFLWKLQKTLRYDSSTATLIFTAQFFDFERRVWNSLKAEIKNRKFDIIHRITPTSAAIPSPIAKWSPVPFVLGPINGGLAYPKGFVKTQLKEGEWLRFVRSAYRLMPYSTATFKHAAAILASFPHTIRTLPSFVSEKTIDCPEVGADSKRFQFKPRSLDKPRCQFLFVGRLVPFKCPLVNILAFAASNLLQQHELIIVGDGPERPNLEAAIKMHHLEGSVRLLGWLPQTQLADLMKSADVFAFPSIRDSGAGVLAEAMMSGLPSITVNYGPPESLLTDECGIRIPLGSFDDHVARFKSAMETLASNPTLRASMGVAAHLRATRTLDWDIKAKRIVQVYEWVLRRRNHKPDFYSEELL